MLKNLSLQRPLAIHDLETTGTDLQRVRIGIADAYVAE
jgi:hypothetical protein